MPLRASCALCAVQAHTLSILFRTMEDSSGRLSGGRPRDRVALTKKEVAYWFDMNAKELNLQNVEKMKV